MDSRNSRSKDFTTVLLSTPIFSRSNIQATMNSMGVQSMVFNLLVWSSQSSAVSLNHQICSFRARIIWAWTCLHSGQSWLFVLVITYINGTKVIQCSHIHKSDSSQKLYFVVCVYILRESANDMTRSTPIADMNCLTSHMDIMPLLISKCPNWTQSYFRSGPGHDETQGMPTKSFKETGSMHSHFLVSQKMQGCTSYESNVRLIVLCCTGY